MNVTLYSEFIRDRVGRKGKFVMIPKHILIDSLLTPQEKLLWMTLATYQYKSSSKIFPSRNRLAQLLGITSTNGISKLTKRLQKKGYLEKYYNSYRRVYYTLYYCNEINIGLFRENISNNEFVESKYNAIKHAPVL